jgi:hypothetical protein
MTLPFSNELIEPIQLGTKLHTFRAKTKKDWRPGVLIHFYALHRQPGMYLFHPLLPVISVQEAALTTEGMFIEGRRLEGAELELFARNDGFATSADFFAFFNAPEGRKPRKLPIEGVLIHWTPLRYGPPPVG